MSDPETVLSAAFRGTTTRDATELARIALRALDEAGYAVARVRFPGFQPNITWIPASPFDHDDEDRACACEGRWTETANHVDVRGILANLPITPPTYGQRP